MNGIRFGQSPQAQNGLIDHNNLLNRGNYTHAQLDSVVDEVIQARGTEPSLKAYIDNTIGNLTTNFMYSRQIPKNGQTVFSLVSTGVGYEPLTRTLQVYVNGGLQDLDSGSYVETDQFTVTFNDGLRDSDVVVFRVDGRNDGNSIGNIAEQEIVQARTTGGTTPITYADLKGRLDSMDSTTAQVSTVANSAYKKPSTGIPKSDLESLVQTSLGKADTSYQKPTTGIPLADLASIVQNYINDGQYAYANSYYKPSTGIPWADLSSVVQSDITQGMGSYHLPAGGIPKTDLSSSVQTSLGKADTSYQKPASGIPKTDLISSIQTSLSSADTAYQKPSTGIPSSDLDQNTKTLLSLANTSYQKPSTGIPKADLVSTIQTSLSSADTAYQKPNTGIPLSDLAVPVGDSHWKAPVSTTSALPTDASNQDGDIRLTLNDSAIHKWDGASSTWVNSQSGSASTSQEVIDSRTNNAASPFTYTSLKNRLDDMDSKIGSGGGGGVAGPTYYTTVNTSDTYQYDSSGNITTISTSGDISKTSALTYDSSGNILQETVTQDGKTYTNTFTYDQVSGELTKVVKSGTESLLVRAAVYDDTNVKGRLTSIEGSANYNVSYTYDTNGNITKEVLLGDINRTTSFSYDSAGNLIQEVKVESGHSTTMVYNYDPVSGVLTSIAVTYV